jgi:hypothetical protein
MAAVRVVSAAMVRDRRTDPPRIGSRFRCGRLSRRLLGHLTLATVGAVIVACGDEGSTYQNSIRVAVSTNLDVPAQMDGLHIVVKRDNNTSFDQTYNLDATDADAGPAVTLPDTLLLHNAEPRFDTGEFKVSHITVGVTGTLDDSPRIVRWAVLNSRTDRPVLLHMRLCADCFGVVNCDCATGECDSCRASATCDSAEVSIDSLPEDDGTQSLEGAECP